MSTEKKSKIGIVILAAGNSSRLGQPKQLLEFKDSTLLKNTIKEALSVPDSIVIVVTGADNEAIQSEINESQITISYNPEWESGMSSSIVIGLKKLLILKPDCESCIFAVCDQPHVTNEVFQDLILEYQQSQKGIIAAAYADTLGTPVLFNKKYFDLLLELKGQQGAKKIINSFNEDTASISFEKGKIDIDTPEDYKNLLS